MATAAATSPTSIIGPQMTVRGTLSGDENLTVEGRIEGNVNLEANLVVAPSATLEATLEVQRVDVHGQVVGDIAASETIVIHAGAQVAGTIRAPEVVVAEGSSFRGTVDMDVPLPEGLLQYESE